MLATDIYSTAVHPLQDNLTVKEALRVLVEKKYNGVIVFDKHLRLVGILSLQDIAAAIVPVEMKENASLAQAMYAPNFFAAQCQGIAKKPIAEIMRTDFVTVHPETSILTVAADFLMHDLYLVPVVSNSGQVLGIITRTEIKKALAEGMGINANTLRR